MWTREQLERRTHELMMPAANAQRYVELYLAGRCPDCGHQPADTYETTIERHARLCAGPAYDRSVLRDARLQLEAAARRIRQAENAPPARARTLVGEARALLHAAEARL